MLRTVQASYSDIWVGVGAPIGIAVRQNTGRSARLTVDVAAGSRVVEGRPTHCRDTEVG